MKILNLIFVMFFLTGGLCAETAALPDILKPQRIYVDGEQLFITEGATIYIYSLKNFKLQKKIGRRGEGPGEFKDSGDGIQLDINPQHVIVASRGRLSYFTRSGEYIKQVNLKNPRRFEFQAIGKGFVGTTMGRDRDSIFFTINFFDADFKKGKEISRCKHPFWPRTKPINAVYLRAYSYYVYQNKIFIDDEKGAVNVLDASGKKLYDIQPKYEKIKVTGMHKKDTWRYGKPILKPSTKPSNTG